MKWVPALLLAAVSAFGLGSFAAGIATGQTVVSLNGPPDGAVVGKVSGIFEPSFSVSYGIGIGEGGNQASRWGTRIVASTDRALVESPPFGFASLSGRELGERIQDVRSNCNQNGILYSSFCAQAVGQAKRAYFDEGWRRDSSLLSQFWSSSLPVAASVQLPGSTSGTVFLDRPGTWWWAVAAARESNADELVVWSPIRRAVVEPRDEPVFEPPPAQPPPPQGGGSPALPSASTPPPTAATTPTEPTGASGGSAPTTSPAAQARATIRTRIAIKRTMRTTRRTRFVQFRMRPTQSARFLVQLRIRQSGRWKLASRRKVSAIARRWRAVRVPLRGAHRGKWRSARIELRPCLAAGCPLAPVKALEDRRVPFRLAPTKKQGRAGLSKVPPDLPTRPFAHPPSGR